MALSETVLGNLIINDLVAQGYSINTVTDLSNSVAKGIIRGLKGTQFLTEDTGIGSGGNGTGTGIFSLSGSLMLNNFLYSTNVVMNDENIISLRTADFIGIIMNNLAIHLQAADLTTTNPDVGSGSSKYIKGSMIINSLSMSSSINTHLLKGNIFGIGEFRYVRGRSLFCAGLGTSIVNALQRSAQASLSISGGTGSSSTKGRGTGTLN